MVKFLKKNAVYIVVYAVLIALVAVGTAYDLDISKAIAAINGENYYSSNFFAAAVECFGEIPVYIFPSFALCSFIAYFQKRLDAAKKYLVTIVFAVVLVGLNYYAAARLVSASNPYFGLKEYAVGATGVAFYLLFGVTCSLVYHLITKKLTKNLSDEKLKSLAICSLIVVLTAVLSQIATQSVKSISNRARYRFMLFADKQGYDGFEFFAPWYAISSKPEIPDAIKELVESDAFRSFPSGHATASFMVLSLTLLPFVYDNVGKRKNKIIVWCVVIVFQIFVAFMRIVAGAHFLTDVCLGSFITLTAFLISKSIFIKKLRISAVTTE